MLVGGSGAGKSTLAHLLLRLMEPTAGQIMVDGTNLLALASETWRDAVTFVPQQPHLFRGTLRENIAFGQAVSEAAIQAAVVAAEAETFVNSLPQGLDTMIGEGGLGLSGGQRQRIAIARAFLKQSPILVLDEVTAHLDVATEQSLATALQRLMKDKIVLLIGHRLQTMRWADTLLVLKQGRLVEQGSFETLLARNGYFSELVHAGLGDTKVADAEADNETNNRVKSETNSQANSEVNMACNMGVTTTSSESCDRGSSVTQAVTTVKLQDVRTTAPQGVTAVVPQAEGNTALSTSTVSTWRSLRRLFAVLGPARNSLWLSLLFSFLTVFMNVGLLTTSAWLITSAALRPELAALSLSIVGVRFFGISRAVCRT